MKYWGLAKITGFTCNIVGSVEAERVVKNRIKWEVKIRRLSVVRKGEQGKTKALLHVKVLVQKKNEEGKKEEQLRKTSFSFVICYNCRGKGCIMKSCMSAGKTMFKKSKTFEDVVYVVVQCSYSIKSFF